MNSRDSLSVLLRPHRGGPKEFRHEIRRFLSRQGMIAAVIAIGLARRLTDSRFAIRRVVSTEHPGGFLIWKNADWEKTIRTTEG